MCWRWYLWLSSIWRTSGWVLLQSKRFSCSDWSNSSQYTLSYIPVCPVIDFQMEMSAHFSLLLSMPEAWSNLLYQNSSSNDAASKMYNYYDKDYDDDDVEKVYIWCVATIWCWMLCCRWDAKLHALLRQGLSYRARLLFHLELEMSIALCQSHLQTAFEKPGKRAIPKTAMKLHSCSWRTEASTKESRRNRCDQSWSLLWANLYRYSDTTLEQPVVQQ